MANGMSDQGVGLRLLIAACGIWVGATWACDTRDATDGPDTSQNGVPAGEGQPERRDPEQVVQRIVASPARSASNGARPTGDTAAPSPKSSVEPLTSKHLEAELNLLEAELGR